MNSSAQITSAEPGALINRNIYGHFAEHLGRCIYEGIWVGEDSPIENTRGIRNDVVAALKKLNIPVLRWPGGCFADEYHWQDGIGPRKLRPSMINTHWGGTVENNHFGTHEFFDLCEQLGTAVYVNGNVGSGSPQEMMQWVEYITSPADSPMANLRRQNGRDLPWKLDFFGVGNESWGCGGSMRPEYYADEYRRYNTFVKNYTPTRVQRIACGSNAADYHWTDVLMERAGKLMDGLSLHYYSLPNDDWQQKGPATNFTEADYHKTMVAALRMDELVSKHGEIMDKYDPEKKVGMVVDEWGIWTDVEPGTNPGHLYQQNSLRDALLAAVTLHIFHQHCERVSMANIAQTINVLQAMILTRGAEMILTPTYHTFEMMKVHQDTHRLPLEIDSPAYELGGKSIPAFHASASRDAGGRVHLSLVNLHAREGGVLRLQLPGGLRAQVSEARVLSAPDVNSVNTFEAPDVVAPAAFSAYALEEAGAVLKVELAARSLVVLTLA